MPEPTSELPLINQPEDSSTGESPEAKLPETPASERIIDMVKGRDGKWTAREPNDPNFFYTPKPENPANTSGEPRSSQKPKDAWAQWQAGEAQRNAQYQQFNQAANEAWANFQQQTNQLGRREALLEQFDRQRHDLGRALLYQSSDTQPIEQRYLSRP